MREYIERYFDTDFLSPSINFALFCAAYVLAALGFVAGVLI